MRHLRTGALALLVMGVGCSGAAYEGTSSSSGYSGGGGYAPPPREDPQNPPRPGPVPEQNQCMHTADVGNYTLFQSADDSNSMASPVIARALIRAGRPVPAGLLRTHEFLNYYRIRYDLPDEGHLRVVPQMLPLDDGSRLLQIGIQAPSIQRRAMVLTFVMDTSGSMTGEPMERQKAAARAIAHQMAQGDVVSMLTWNTAQQVAVDRYRVSGPDDSGLLFAINALTAEGGTDLEGGLRRGYELAQQQYDPGKLNRVILISDGQANVGVTSEDLIAMHSHSADEEGIYLVGVGVGNGVNDTLMDTVTDKGRGAYVYLDSNAEADRIFGERFDEVMDVAARGVRLELTLPWHLEVDQFHGEEMSENPQEIEPQHLAPGDTMVFNQTLKSCGGNAMLDDDPVRIRATFAMPRTLEEREEVVETTIGGMMAGNSAQLAKGTAIAAYAEALKSVDGLDAAAARAKIDEALAKVDAALQSAPDDELDEIKTLLTSYRGRL